MRAVLSISIAPKKLQAIKKKAKMEGLTISAYVIRMFDEEEKMMTEEELLEDIHIGEQELRDGKGTVLRSENDIDQFFKNLR